MDSIPDFCNILFLLGQIDFRIVLKAEIICGREKN